MANAPWYRTGTVAVTNGSTAVTGTQTLWTGQVAEGDIFKGPDGKDYEVASTPASNTALTLRTAYTGATLSAQSYAIVRNFTGTIPAELAASLAAMLAKWHISVDDFLAVLLDAGSTSTINDATGTPRTVTSWAGILGTIGGRLAKALTGGTVALTDAEASNKLLDFSGALTSNAIVTLPAKTGTWAVANGTTGNYSTTIKTPAGTGVAIPQGGKLLIRGDGTNIALGVDIPGLGLSWVKLGDDPLALVRREALGSAAYMDWPVLPANLFVRSVTAAETLTSQDRGRVIAASNTITLTAPAASDLSTGWWCWVKNTGSGTVTVQRGGADAIDGGTSFALAAGERKLLVWQSSTTFLTL